MNFILKITLKSDLCAASGDGFSDNIDTDVAYDKFGLPYIPAKRLKGCLKDASKIILSDNEINGMFGLPGMEKGCGIVISNARLFKPNEYSTILQNERSESIPTQSVLEQFTDTRAQTAIDENGTAKEKSLRFTRVVSHYSPLHKNEETIFYAKVSVDEKYKNALGKSCKALRNIGYNRNRGLGAVKCELLDDEDAARINTFELKNDVEYILSYRIRLDSPLMITENNGKESLDFIPGKSVLGCMAGKLKESELFEDLFLKNNVRFSNLYPISQKNGTPCIPAITLVGKNKTAENKDEKFGNISLNNGKALKPLKKGYIDQYCWPYEVEQENIYHNNLSDKEQNDKNTLYTQYCISEGQKYYGTIEGKGEYLRHIIPVLQNGLLTFGRSKTAQYSTCSLDGEVACVEKEDIKIKTVPGEKYAYVLLSDVILLNSQANYKPSIEDLKSAVGVQNVDESLSSLFFTTVTGYNSKRNQKNAHIRAIKRGSCIVFESNGEDYSGTLYIGERQSEGFGKVVLKKVSEIAPQNVVPESATTHNSLLTELFRNHDEEACMQRAVDYALENRDLLISITASFVGRVLLMIDQSSGTADLNSRIDSIKNEGKKVTIQNIKGANQLQSASFNQYKKNLRIVFIMTKYFLKQEGKADDENIL